MMRVRRVLSDALLDAAEQRPQHEAIVTDSERWNYATLHLQALRFAGQLLRAGVQRGERVVLFMDNSAEAVACMYGTWLAGAVSVMVNPQTKEDKLRFILLDCAASYLVSDGLLRTVAVAAAEGVESLRGHSDPLSIAEQTPAETLPFVNALDLAALIYTSGSTGTPKGVMMTHSNMVFTCWSLVEYLRLDAGERILNVLPLAFDYGMYQALMAVHLGATLVLERNFSFPVSVLARAREERVTVFPGVPTLFATLVSMQKRNPLELSDVRCVTNTAAHLPDDFVPVLSTLFPDALIFRMYGLTECKRVCYLEPELVNSRPGSVGKAIPGTEVFLLDDDGKPVPPGQSGTLYVRGPHVMQGYWNLPEQTARMLRPGPLPNERILCTHDLFRMDEEGFLYFEGRSDDIIKSRGEKVSPVEVENVLHALPGVREAAVIGEEDPLLGEAVVAYVVLEDAADADERSLRRQAAARLEGYMVPSVWRFVTELPKTDTGKVRKQSLREAVK